MAAIVLVSWGVALFEILLSGPGQPARQRAAGRPVLDLGAESDPGSRVARRLHPLRRALHEVRHAALEPCGRLPLPRTGRLLHLPQVSRARNGGTDVPLPYRVPCLPQRLLLRHPGLRLLQVRHHVLNRASETRKTWKIRPATCPAWARDSRIRSRNPHRGHIRFPQDFKGKWIILFKPPRRLHTTYAPPNSCSSARCGRSSTPLGCQLLGLSVGALTSHIAWLRSIRERSNTRASATSTSASR